jgi:hypothetical protein
LWNFYTSHSTDMVLTERKSMNVLSLRLHLFPYCGIADYALFATISSISAIDKPRSLAIVSLSNPSAFIFLATSYFVLFSANSTFPLSSCSRIAA